jgi:hypothetical protein
MRIDLQEVFSTGASPSRSRARIAAGAVEKMFTLWLSTNCRKRAVGVVRHAREHQRRRGVRRRAIDDVGVPGYPADVGGAPEDLALVAGR